MLMENQLNALKGAKSELDSIKQDLLVSKTETVRSRELAETLEGEKRELKTCIADQISSFQKERELLIEKIHSLEKDLAAKAAAFYDSEQALRVKNKMLDDQNDTIKTLKQNLENKIREHSALTQEIQSNDSRLAENLSKEKKRARELSGELATQEEALNQLQEAFHECKEERDALHSELMEVTKSYKKGTLALPALRKRSLVSRIFSRQKNKN
ncbi:hypothetical protein BDR26DRAFT_664718 [Obelidium mucronatum]|nr:hypothetical protein BDR26DRAFT_664718 [Obelidium mucronatum]